MKHKLSLSIKFIVLVLSPTAALYSTQNIIFGLNEVLFTIKPIASFPESFLGNYINNTINDTLIESSCKRLFEIVTMDEQPQEDTSPPLFYRGSRMPQLWARYFLNKISAEQAYGTAEQAITQHGYFYERTMLYKAAHIAFDPLQETACMFPIDTMQELVQQLSTDSNNQLFTFSNNNNTTLEELARKYPAYFKPFESRVITSHTLEALKPDPLAFRKIIEKYDLNTENTYFIDSEEASIACAQKFGIQSILFDKINIQAVKELLFSKKLGVCP